LKTIGPLTILEEIDSTSSEVSRRLEAGLTPPFAVAAYSQLQGRGRRGKTWVGTPGNIFISFALEVSDTKILALLSLEIAVLVARWIKEKFHFSVTLKWPNDLFFHGKKLGGILCEASLFGDQVHGVVVGIGLNIEPVLNALEVEHYSIRQITSLPFELDDLLSDLANFVFQNVFSGMNVKESFFEFGTTGSLWCQDGVFFKEKSISDSGSLILENLSTGERVNLQSSFHDFKWHPQLHQSFEYLIGDFGNSRMKIAIVKQGELSQIFSFESSQEMESFLKTANLDRKFIFMGNVANFESSDYKRIFSNMTIQVVGLRKKTILLNLGNYSLQQLGIDRLAFLESFLGGLDPASRTHSEIGILVSLGTATTIDCVRGNGEYLGGVIQPGMQMSLKSLHEKTHLLPDIDLLKEKELREWQKVTGTSEAMISGLKLSIDGSITKIKTDLLLKDPACRFQVVYTGGGARFFMSDQVDEKAILRGLYYLSIS
jgi:biotin-[acetyl-CoA-carboxylase] ligase BirA-like protein